jgi:hypothetical protein
MNHHRPSRNDPSPCGSGNKYKDCCRRKEIDAQSNLPSPKITDLGGKPKMHPEYPIGTVALYGPNDKITTKIAASAIRSPNAEPILERWVATDVLTSPKVQLEIKEFFERHGVKSIAMSEGNMGCPHEEGEDFPEGEDCPFCPFWAGKQGSNQRF